METILAVQGLKQHTDNAFRWELLRLCKRLGLNADYLATVMAIETGGIFSPTVENPDSGAVGLLQWTATGAKADGTTQAALRKMSAREQLTIVERRYKPFGHRKLNACDHYLVVFAPARVGKPLDATVYDDINHPAAYAANKGLDKSDPPDGVITVHEACAPMYREIAKAKKRPRIEVTPPASWGTRLTVALAGVGAAAGAWWRWERRR